MNFKFTPEAVDDLVRLREFIEEKNPIAAQRVAKEILNGIEKLRSFPEIGLKVLRAPLPELIRDLFIGKYTIRYFINEDEIIILRMWHGKEIEKDL
jgi:plasmid stabilization system protein ParE